MKGYFALLGIGLFLVGCNSPTPEEKKAAAEAYEESLRYVDARAMGNGTQIMLKFKGDSAFDLAEALEKYVMKHDGKRRVVSVSPWPHYGDTNFVGYWVVVERVEDRCEARGIDVTFQ